MNPYDYLNENEQTDYLDLTSKKRQLELHDIDIEGDMMEYVREALPPYDSFYIDILTVDDSVTSIDISHEDVQGVTIHHDISQYEHDCETIFSPEENMKNDMRLVNLIKNTFTDVKEVVIKQE